MINFFNKNKKVRADEIDYGKEIYLLHGRIDLQIKLYYKLSQKIELLMEHLNIKFETVDEKPSVPEHLIIIKKKKT